MLLTCVYALTANIYSNLLPTCEHLLATIQLMIVELLCARMSCT